MDLLGLGIVRLVTNARGKDSVQKVRIRPNSRPTGKERELLEITREEKMMRKLWEKERSFSPGQLSDETLSTDLDSPDLRRTHRDKGRRRKGSNKRSETKKDQKKEQKKSKSRLSITNVEIPRKGSNYMLQYV